MNIKKIHNGINIQTSIEAPIQDVFNYWFNPPQIIPPLKEIHEIDFKIGGNFLLTCSVNEDKEFKINGTFKNIFKEKELVFEWNSPRMKCVILNKYTELSNNRTFVDCSQYIKKSNIVNLKDIVDQLFIMYVAGMKQVFKKISQT